MIKREEILIGLLAQACALFEPLRRQPNAVWAATFVLRWRFQTRGLPWRGGGEMMTERALCTLVEDDLVMRRRAARQTVGARLTPKGLAVAWTLVGTSAHADLVVTREVDRLGPGGLWVAEVAFAPGCWDGEDHGAELKRVQSLLMPGLVTQWLESLCDMQGRIAYKTTEAGRIAILEAAGRNGHAKIEDAPEPEPEAIDHYLRTYSETLMWLDSLTPEGVGARGEIGALHLSCATWGDPAQAVIERA
jgi:hypothetical protein